MLSSLGRKEAQDAQRNGSVLALFGFAERIA
jgi:hypothetical protein